jgi:hypothetical protein
MFEHMRRWHYPNIRHGVRINTLYVSIHIYIYIYIYTSIVEVYPRTVLLGL